MITVIVLALAVAALAGVRALSRWPRRQAPADRIRQVMRAPHH